MGMNGVPGIRAQIGETEGGIGKLIALLDEFSRMLETVGASVSDIFGSAATDIQDASDDIGGTSEGTSLSKTVGGMTQTGQLSQIQAELPQIPLMAKGAVLPENRQFLASVGEREHGTDPQDPMSPVHEAKSLTLVDAVRSNMAGHEATVDTLRQILTAVMGIQIGDEAVGRAAERFQDKMAIITGVR